MATINQREGITRRSFLEFSSVAVAAGLIGDGNQANAAPMSGTHVDEAKPDSAPMARKIALEEHFALP